MLCAAHSIKAAERFQNKMFKVNLWLLSTHLIEVPVRSLGLVSFAVFRLSPVLLVNVLLSCLVFLFVCFFRYYHAMVNDYHEPLVEVAAQLLVVLLDADIVPNATSLATGEEVGVVRG